MEKLVFLSLLFNILFPKAGTKIGGTPIYLGVIISVFLSLKVYLEKMKVKTKQEFHFWIITIVIFIINFLLPSILDINDIKIQWIIISIFTIVIYPSIYFIPKMYPRINYKKILKSSLIILLLYGYTQKIFGDYNVVIPGITANYSEAITANFLHQKHNFLHALGILKMTSTYQNGNLFGLNITLIFWTIIIYFNRKERVVLSFLFLGAVILSGSASTYLGNLLLVLLIVFNKILIKKDKNIILIVIFTLCSIFLVSNLFDLNIFEILRKRLFERDIISGGGRFKNAYKELDLNYYYLKDYLLGKSLVNGGFNEMIFVTTFFRFGIIGIVLFLIRNLIFYNFSISLRYYYGVVGFLFNSIFDSGIIYPPVYFNYFFILGFIELQNSKIKKRRDKLNVNSSYNGWWKW